MPMKTLKAKQLDEFIRGLDDKVSLSTGSVASYHAIGYKGDVIYEISVANALQGDEVTGTVREISRKREKFLIDEYLPRYY